MGCGVNGCGVSYSSEEHLINDFFRNLPIRKYKPKEVVEFIIQSINIYPNKSEEQHRVFLDKFLINPDYKSESSKMFMSLYNDCTYFNKTQPKPPYFNFNYLLVVYIILCRVDSEQAHTGCFRLINEDCLEIDTQGDMIQKETLKNIIKLYLTVITSYSISFMENSSNDFEKLLNIKEKGFKDEVIDLYIDNYLLSHIGSSSISLYKFFHKNYDRLTLDEFIRSKIISLSIQHTENINRRQISFDLCSIKSDRTNFTELKLGKNTIN